MKNLVIRVNTHGQKIWDMTLGHSPLTTTVLDAAEELRQSSYQSTIVESTNEIVTQEVVETEEEIVNQETILNYYDCLLYTSPSPRDRQKSRMPSSA